MFGMFGVLFQRLVAEGKYHTSGYECIAQPCFSYWHELQASFFLTSDVSIVVGYMLHVCMGAYRTQYYNSILQYLDVCVA